MDTAGQLLSRIVDESRITEVIRSGIEDKFFDDDTVIVYKHVLRHYNDYKKVPSRDAVLQAFPNFRFKDAPEPLEYYIDQLKEAYRVNILDDKLRKAAGVYQRDSHAAETFVRDALSELQITDRSFKDISLAESLDDILEAYDEKKANPGATGILSGWKKMDDQTLGWQPGEFAVLAGEKYMGKSWLMIHIAIHAMLQEESVVFVTREMSQIQVLRRAASILAHVPFDSLRKGELTNSEEKRFREAIRGLEGKNYRFHISQNGIYNIDDMKRKAVEKDATFMLADSVYLFMPDSRKEQLGEVQKRLAISQKCKQTAQELGIPFLVSVQAGRRNTKKIEAPTLDNIEWSNAFAQDGDTVFFTQKDDMDKELYRSQIWLVKSRDGQEDDFFINQDFERMDFTQRDDQREPTTKVFEEDEETFFRS